MSPSSIHAREAPRPNLGWPGVREFTLFAIAPFAILIALLSDDVLGGGVPYDFRVYYDAARSLIDGASPYVSLETTVDAGGYVYPPLTAIAAMPLTVLPAHLAGLLVMCLLAAAVLAIPFVLGVRDWRCFGLVLLCPPTIQGLQASNITILIGLLAALAWRFRDRAAFAGSTVATAFAAKFMLGPLVIWLAATRRYAATTWAGGIALVLIAVPWAAIGFIGLSQYPGLVRGFGERLDDRAYSVYGAALGLGFSSVAAHLLAVALVVALLLGVVVTGRRDERTSYVLAVAASLAVSPIVWLPYFVLLVVVIAVAQQSLGYLWFVPLLMWTTAGSYDPSAYEKGGTVAIAALTVVLAIRTLRRDEHAAEVAVVEAVT